MLLEFLRTIRNGNVQSLLEVSRTMNISREMALRMAKEMAGKGYLQEFGADCGMPQTACSDCPAGSGCQVLTRHWSLTEKGKAAIT